jgi:hypothetical protein
VVVAGLLTFTLGAVLSLLLQGLRIYQHTASADWAGFDAGQAVAQLQDEIRACFRVTGRYSDRITVSRPLKAWDATAGGWFPVQPITEGESVRYYLSDAGGILGGSGMYLWRAVRAANGTTYLRDARPLADNIVTLQFAYEMGDPPRDASARYVTMTIEARVKEGGTLTTRSHSARMALRNYALGPVTDETGIDEEGE